MSIPMALISGSIYEDMTEMKLGAIDTIKRPYVNKAEVVVRVENVYEGTAGKEKRNDWLQPADYMLLIKESSMSRFFANKELPTDTCALLSALTQGKDSLGNATYYYSYDLSDFITNQLRQESNDTTLTMLLVPVSVGTSYTSSGTSTITSVTQQQTMSATKIRSAKNGMRLEIVYSGF